jgi:hypothetical protein
MSADYVPQLRAWVLLQKSEALLQLLAPPLIGKRAKS